MGVAEGFFPLLATQMPQGEQLYPTPTPYHDVLPHSRLPKLPQKPRAKINIYPLELFASSILSQ